MLYRYFVGSREVDIDSVEAFYNLYQKGMINGSSKVYDVRNNIYVDVSEMLEFKAVLDGNYENSGNRAGKVIRFAISAVLLALVLILNLVNGFIRFGFEGIKENTAYSLGYITGGLLGTIAVIALVTLIIVKATKKHNSTITLIFSAAYFLLSVFFLANSIHEIRIEKEKEKLSFQKIISLFTEVPENEPKKENISEEKYGKLASLVEITQDCVWGMWEIRDDLKELYNRPINDEILSDKVVEDIGKVRESRERIRSTLNEINDCEDKANNIFDKYLSDVEKLDLPARAREVYFRSVKDPIEASRIKNNESFDLQRQVFSIADNMLKLLEQRQGKYIVENDQILFYEDRDVDNYNKLVEEYNSKLENIENFKDEIWVESQESIKELENFIEEQY